MCLIHSADGEGGQRCIRDRAKALVNHGGTDDLGKAQCSNGKIVALELQHRQADEEGEQRCDKTGQDQAEHNLSLIHI